MELKSLKKNAIAAALEKAKHYRLLNDPENAESICLDILAIEPAHQEATIALILALTDQFDGGSTAITEARLYLSKLNSEYRTGYYAGLICEKAGRAILVKGNPRSKSVAYHWFREAMEHFERAETISSDENDDAVLRWNSCLRTITKRKLNPASMKTTSPTETNLI